MTAFGSSLAFSVPLHRQIGRILEGRILNGMYPRGSMIPPEMRLCEEFGASRITVRQAIAGLVERGLLRRYRGRGTVVSETIRPTGPPAATGYLEDVMLFFTATRVVTSERHVIPASPEIAEQLGIAAGSPIAVITRARTLDGLPFSISSTHLDVDLAARIGDDDLAGSTFIEMLERRLGASLAGARQVLWAANADEHIARQLELAPGAAVFCLGIQHFAADDRPVAYTRTSFRGDRYRHHIHLGRVPINQARRAQNPAAAGLGSGSPSRAVQRLDPSGQADEHVNGRGGLP